MPNVFAFPDMTKPMLNDCGFFENKKFYEK